MKTPEAVDQEIKKINESSQTIVTQGNEIKEAAVKDVNGLKEELDKVERRLASLGACTLNIHEVRMNIEKEKCNLNSLYTDIGVITAEIGQIEKAKQELEELNQKIGDKRKQAEIHAFWEVGFKDIKSQIIKEFLPKFEDTVNCFLSRLKTDMQVDFDTERLKASATKKEEREGRGLKEEFSIKIKKNGEELPYNLHLIS